MHGTMRNMMKTMAALFTAGTVLFALAGCDKGAVGGKEGKTETKANGKADGKAASGSGDSVGAPECDEVLKKAAECKDKPGMSAITANRENWKNGVANATTKDATIMACKAAMEAVKAVGCDAQAGGATSPGAGATSAAAGSLRP